ncbi:uncharacterized protein BJX67DRAFT_325026 [Aspergillus lucknowensis]|uniref:Vacuolar membrane protein n=1 Tax=Aspergillus lucknowensis TaxID=176173 RepID=A0ABR4L8K7_9EURO
MHLLPMRRSTARRPHLLLFLFLAIVIFAQLAAAQDDSDSSNDNNDSDATDDSSDDTSSTTDNYPVVTVPPTDDAPYMQKSAAPEGTVFIAVGAVLGAMGLSVLAWRGLVAWSVNRSVRRAAIMHSSENKGLLRGKKKRSGRSHPRGNGHTHHNAVSLEKISGNRHSTYRGQRGSKIPTSGSGLFFSPTAGMNNSGNRGSNYLPAGYYAAGNAAAGLAQNVGLSSDHLPPQVRGYTRTGSGPTPPATPLSPTSGIHDPQQYSNSNLRQSYTAAASISSLNLTSPPQGRTPSAYLEDLFENHPPRSPNRHN